VRPDVGRGGDLPGFSGEFLAERGRETQFGVMINVNPLPVRLSVRRRVHAHV
jgi:hypothetical protein